MKKIIFSAIFCVAIAGFASAQTSKNKSSKTTTYTSTSSHKAKKQVRKKSSARIEAINNQTVPDNRKEYVKDGQLATRTGHEAAPTNGEQFQSLKDSANKKRKKQ